MAYIRILFFLMVFGVIAGVAAPGVLADDDGYDRGGYNDPFDKPKDRYSGLFKDETPKEDRFQTSAPRRNSGLENGWNADKKRRRLGDIQRDQMKSRSDD